jgi:hypothetical protein
MKNNLRTFGLVLCILPMYLHGRAGQDMEQAYQPITGLNAGYVEPIAAGTVLPVLLNSTLRSDKSRRGDTITATVMQDVTLAAGKTLRRGSRVTGHVVEAISPGKRSDESKISLQFDGVQFENRILPVTANIKALASVMEVAAAQVPGSGGAEDFSGNWNLGQIGGDQVSYGQGGLVMLGSDVVGSYTSQGVLAKSSPDLGSECRSIVNRNSPGQSFWLFSVNACGSYGFGDLRVLHSGRAGMAGETTLSSNRKVVKIGRGSAMLLRVQGGGAEVAKDHTTSSRATGQ